MFDGDEMNLHAPQSVEAATELREIAAVPKQLISPRLSKPLVSVVQDTLVGVNRLTRPTEFFTRRDYMNLLVHSKRWNGKIPPPAKTDPAILDRLTNLEKPITTEIVDVNGKVLQTAEVKLGGKMRFRLVPQTQTVTTK